MWWTVANSRYINSLQCKKTLCQEVVAGIQRVVHVVEEAVSIKIPDMKVMYKSLNVVCCVHAISAVFTHALGFQGHYSVVALHQAGKL